MNAFTSVAAASIASATAVAAPSIVGPDNPDAELIALGSELRALLAKDNELDAKIWPLEDDSWETAEMETGICADDIPKLSREDANKLIHAHWDAKKANGGEALCEESERLWNDISNVISRIEALPVHGLAGLGPKALAAACTNKNIWQHDDWDNERLWAFFSSVFAAAGMECPYKFDPSAEEPKAEPVKYPEKPNFPGRIADETGFAPNVPVFQAIVHHQKAWEATEQLNKDVMAGKWTNCKNDDEPQRICKVEFHSLRAVELSYAANIHEAAIRAVYLAKYWSDQGEEESGENAFPSLSNACLSFRLFLPIV